MSIATVERVEVPDDIRAFSADALARGWSDGLPVVPPTPDLVAEYVEASGLPDGHVLGRLYPNGVDATVSHIAVNAVLAGAPPEAMPLLCAAVSAIADPLFDLAGINATTASVVPAMIVNGPIRDAIGIPYRFSALGGVAGPAPAIGRALRLVIRNVAGQVAGVTSESVFGQPGRVAGIVFGEWEEKSPWPALAARRGVPGDAVTMVGVLGTANILDNTGATGQEILEVVAKSIAFMGNNNLDAGSKFAQQTVALNPIWAEKVARDIPSFDDVRELVHRFASHPLDWFPEVFRPALQEVGKVRPDGRVYLMDSPEDLNLVVCGGMGNLHAAMMPGMSHTLAVTRAISADARLREAADRDARAQRAGQE